MAADGLFRAIANFEDRTPDGDRHAWLGRAPGLLVGVTLLLGVAALSVLAVVIVFALESRTIAYLVGLGWLLVATSVSAYWRRQRLAAHFDRAQRWLASSQPAERDRGLADLVMNARRGRAEHGRIAGTLSAYLRAAPAPLPDEAGRRQLAFSILTDRTLTMAATKGLDLAGAHLAGVFAPGADLAGVRLRGADLSRARLARADLSHADLVDTVLDGADLGGANLQGTILDRSQPAAAGR